MASIDRMRWLKIPTRDGITPVLEEVKTSRNMKPHHDFPTRKRDTITTENILWFFRKPRTMEAAMEFFGIKGGRHSERFSLLFTNLRRKLYLSERENPDTKIVTYKSQRYKHVRRDDSEGAAAVRSEPAV